MVLDIDFETCVAKMRGDAGAGTKCLGVDSQHFITFDVFEKNPANEWNNEVYVETVWYPKQRQFWQTDFQQRTTAARSEDAKNFQSEPIQLRTIERFQTER